MEYIGIAFDILSFAAVLFVCFKYARLRKQKENEYYTDYVHNGLVLRVYKMEFEYEAVGNIPSEKILDRGNLSKFYDWCLFEK